MSIRDSLSQWMARPMQTREDEFDEVSKDQNVEDPVWPSAPLEPDVQTIRVPTAPFAPDPEASGEVRLIDGVLDFMEEVAEEIFSPDKEPEKKDSRYKAPVLDVQERAATSWRATSYNIASGGGTRILTARDDRVRAIVSNWGPGIAYLSHVTGSNIGGSNVIQIPVNGTREFRTADEIYAYPAVAGTTQIVDVQDEYGKPE